MKIIGWVRMADRAACGGIVIEGDHFCTSNGRPYTFMGAKMACPKNCVVAEGYLRSTLMNGRPQVLHGMTTSGGCPLLSTLNDEDGVGNEPNASVPTRYFLNADGVWTGVLLDPAHVDEAYDEQGLLQTPCAEGMPYFIQTLDGRTFIGRVGPAGRLPRVATYGEDEFEVFWGDEALAKMTGEHANG